MMTEIIFQQERTTATPESSSDEGRLFCAVQLLRGDGIAGKYITNIYFLKYISLKINTLCGSVPFKNHSNYNQIINHFSKILQPKLNQTVIFELFIPIL